MNCPGALARGELEKNPALAKISFPSGTSRFRGSARQTLTTEYTESNEMDRIILYIDIFLLTFAIGIKASALCAYFPSSYEDDERANIGRSC